MVTIGQAIGLASKEEVTQEISQMQKQGGLVFKPNSKAKYQSSEFDCVADINSLGLRNKESL